MIFSIGNFRTESTILEINNSLVGLNRKTKLTEESVKLKID